MKLTDIIDLSRMHELKHDDIFLAHLSNMPNKESMEVYLGMNPFIDEMKVVIDFHIETANYDDLQTLYPIPHDMGMEVATYIDENMSQFPIFFRTIAWWETILNLRNYGGTQMSEKIILKRLNKKNEDGEQKPPPDASGN